MRKKTRDVIFVSGCLSGHNPSYNGRSERDYEIAGIAGEGKAIPVCPELLGGLSIPRPRSEIQNGTGRDVLAGRARVITEFGKDVTGHFIAGAESVLALAKKYNVRMAVFKARSPACGCGEIYDGGFTGRTKKGDGVATALLKQAGIKVVTEASKGQTLATGSKAS